MTGKGSRPRNNYSKRFRDRFEEIDWKHKHKQHKPKHDSFDDSFVQDALDKAEHDSIINGK